MEREREDFRWGSVKDSLFSSSGFRNSMVRGCVVAGSTRTGGGEKE